MRETEDEGRSWRLMGIYAKNREEWAFTSLATQRQNGTVVAFYDTLGPSGVEYIIRQTRLETISCAIESLRSLIMLKSQGRAESIKNFICFDRFESEIAAEAQAVGVNLFYFGDVIEAGREIISECSFQEPTPDSVALFCYTSGTTSDPKAGKLTHGNLISVVAGARVQGFDIDHTDCMISYLPLAHSFEQVLFTASLTYGTKIGYFSGDVTKLTDDC